jgi:hypothetical protein
MTTGTPFLYELIKSRVSRHKNDLDGLDNKDISNLEELMDIEGDTLPYDTTDEKETRSEKRAHSVGAFSQSIFFSHLGKADQMLSLSPLMRLR